MKLSPWRVAGAAIPLALCLAAAAAPQPPVGVTREEIDVRLVNVDVYVTDREGEPVTGLTKEDFELFEDDRPVEITNFSEIRGVPPAVAGPPAGAAAEPTRVPTLAADDGPGLLVVYIDNATLLPSHRNRVLTELETFLAAPELGGRSLMLVTNQPGLELSAGPTRDIEEIRAALGRAAKRTARGVGGRAERASAYQTVADIYRCYEDGPCPGSACGEGWTEMLAVMQAYASSVQGGGELARAGLTDLVRSLAGFPGRKEIIYLSDGFAREPGLADFGFLGELCPEREREVWASSTQFGQTSALKRVGAFANANRVTIHALEATGLGSSSIGSVEWGDRRFTPSPRIDHLHRANLQASLFTLADETGGVSIFNANRPLADLVRLARTSSHYYSLGFFPDHHGDGEIHQLHLRLEKKAAKGATLRYRRKYRDTPEDERLAERALAALLFGLEENPLGARAGFGAGDDSAAGTARVPLEIEIPVANLATLSRDEGEQGMVRLVIITADDRGASSVREKRHAFVSPQQPGQEDLDQRLVIEMELEPGTHRLGIGIRDEIAGTTSYLRTEIEIAGKRSGRVG